MKPVFLSASLPDLKRHPKYHSTADLMAIRECVRALATVVLPRARLVFGGHPAITPLVKRVGERLGAMSRIRLYQSAFFADHFPKDNATFSGLMITKAVPDDRQASLHLMRQKMIASEAFGAGVFVGGMEGVEEEFEMFRSLQPKARLLPVASTGAAARIVFESLPVVDEPGMLKLASSRVYGALFEELLGLHRPSPPKRAAKKKSPRKKAT
jgi:hypothetical protein